MHVEKGRASRRRNSRIPVLLAATTVLAGTFLVSCSSQDDEAPGGAHRTVTVRISGDVDTLDPALTRTTIGAMVVDSLYDRLIDTDKDGKPIPYLATSWQQTPTNVTLQLRKDVKCPNGEVLTASDVAKSLERVADSNTKSPKAALIFGGQQPTISADDAKASLSITLKQPFSDLLVGLAQTNASVVCPEGLTDPKPLASKPAGTGAYTLSAMDKGTSYTLTAKTGYTWGPGGISTGDRGFPLKVIFSVVTNDSTAANLLLSGDLDIASVQGPDLKRLQSQKDLFSVLGQDLGATLLIFNQKKQTFKDPGVRKALALALNRDDYNKAATGGSGEVINNPAPNAAGCPEDKGQELPKQDTEETKRLLTSSGWAAAGDGMLTKDGEALTARIIGWNTARSGGEYVSDTLHKLGVSTALSVVDLNTLVNIVIAGKEDWDIVLLPSSPTMQSPNAISVYFTGAAPPAGTNVGSVSNSTYESNRTIALSSTGDARCEAWVTSTRALTASFDVFPVIHEDVPWFGRDVSFETYTSLVMNPLSIRANG